MLLIGDFPTPQDHISDFDMDNAVACWWAVQDEVLSGVHIEQLTVVEQVSLQTALVIAQASQGSERYAAVQHLHAVALPIGNKLHDEEVAGWRHRVLPVSHADWPLYGMGVACERAVVPAFPRDTERLATTLDINMMTARMLSDGNGSTGCMLTVNMAEVIHVCNTGLQAALTSVAGALQRSMHVATRHDKCLLILMHIPGGVGNFVSIALHGARQTIYAWDSLGSFSRSVITGLKRSSGWPVVDLQLPLQADDVHCGFWTVWFCETFMLYAERLHGFMARLHVQATWQLLTA